VKLHNGFPEKGFEQITPFDSTERRALWMRCDPPAEDSMAAVDLKSIELRAGREGDDTQVILRVGETITEKLLCELAEAMHRGKDASEDFVEYVTKKLAGATFPLSSDQR